MTKDHTTVIHQYGFTFGPADVRRCCSDKKHGVWLEIETPRQTIMIRVTNSGIIKAGNPQPKART